MSRAVACIPTYVASGTRYVCCVFLHKYSYIQYRCHQTCQISATKHAILRLYHRGSEICHQLLDCWCITCPSSLSGRAPLLVMQCSRSFLYHLHINFLMGLMLNKVRLRESVDSLCRDGTDMPVVGMGLQIYCQKMAKPLNCFSFFKFFLRDFFN